MITPIVRLIWYGPSFVGLYDAITRRYVAFLPYGRPLVFLKWIVFVSDAVPFTSPCARHTISLLFASIHNLTCMTPIRCLYSYILPDSGLSTALRETMTALILPW